jgi:predicted negative regulator of RcsB-dependent stress response
MSRNALIAIIVVLIAGLAILGYVYYQDQQTTSIEMSVGEGGISISAD